MLFLRIIVSLLCLFKFKIYFSNMGIDFGMFVQDCMRINYSRRLGPTLRNLSYVIFSEVVSIAIYR